MKQKWFFWIRILIFIGLGIALLAYGLYSMQLREPLNYTEHLDEVAVTVDGREITLGDMYFYVLYEEQVVESAAEVYDSEQTRHFWNIHTNQSFVQEEAKDNIMGMAVHDAIFYEMACRQQMVLSSEEKATLEHRRSDFWSDLYDIQKEELPVSYDKINRTMQHIALAQKAQAKLVEETEGVTYAGYDWQGKDYQRLMEAHEVKVNKKIWKRVLIGNVSLEHDTLITID
ncbi:MAG: hypothetical protein K6G04_02270 [Lachnospiraceae bacterium]|nr:hypothetical protein [Lachnospiraceae bacterium]